MKNTVKKILALVFVVAMVCSLAVPAFAADVNVSVELLPYDQSADVVETSFPLKDSKATVEQALRTADTKANGYSLTIKDGKLTSVTIGSTAFTKDQVPGVLETAKWVVALNGKIISEDLRTVAVAEGDVVSVFLYEGTFATKFAQYDDSNIEAGVISFYYYDIEGNKKPLVGATVTLDVKNLLKVVSTETLASGETAGVDTNGMPSTNEYGYNFTTDEKGQIWVAPQFLNADITIESVTLSAAKALEEGKTDLEGADFTYYNSNLSRNFEGRQLKDTEIDMDDKYIVAGATGDMTVVYVMVAAAAVITLGAVVIMKKKAVKAN